MTAPRFQCISVVGLGYIGLPTAAMFASQQIKVIGVDVNQQTVDTINRGEVHIVEPQLDRLVCSVVDDGFLRATTTPEPADVFVIAVPTPFNRDNQQPDLSFIQAAINSICSVLEKGNLVILESTSPVGTTETVANWLAEARPDLTFPQNAGEGSDIRVAYCPERVLPGKVMQELISNDRVIGGITPKCSERALKLYQTFVKGDCVIASGPRAAELAKLTENSFRDVNIAFANELSLICDDLEINTWELISLANRHPRVNILQPGPGVGGHCIAVDPWFIVSSSPDNSRLIRVAREVNDAKPAHVVGKVNAAISECLANNSSKTEADILVAIYGLAFKPDVDDLRESPALEIAITLALEHRGPLLVVEPFIDALPRAISAGTLVDYQTALNADVHVLLVDHAEFKHASRPIGKLVDCRGIWGS